MEQQKESGKKYKIVYDRTGCIGAAACCASCPNFWEIVDDGKADLKGATHNEDNTEQVLEIEEKDYQCNKEAADACPVNVIHIFDKETGKKII